MNVFLYNFVVMMQKLDLSDREYIMFLTLIIIDPGNKSITNDIAKRVIEEDMKRVIEMNRNHNRQSTRMCTKSPKSSKSGSNCKLAGYLGPLARYIARYIVQRVKATIEGL